MPHHQHTLSKREIACKNNDVKFISRLSVVFALISIPIGWLVARAVNNGGWGEHTFMLWLLATSSVIFVVGLVLALSNKIQSLKLWHAGALLNSLGLVALLVAGFSTFMASTVDTQDTIASIESTEMTKASGDTDPVNVTGTDMADVTDSAEADYITDGTQAANIIDNTQVAEVTGSTEVADVTDSAEADYITDGTPAANITDNTQVAEVTGSTEVADVTDSAEADYITDGTQAANITDSTEVADVTDSTDMADLSNNTESASTDSELSTNETTDLAEQGDNSCDIQDNEFQSTDNSFSESFQSSDSYVVNVNDWGSGFQVQHECVLPANIDQLNRFEIAIDYSGAGIVNTSWMHGYNGPIESGYVLSDGGIGIKSSERYVPDLRGNDVLLFTTQVDGARYAANDFNLDCRIQGRI